MSTSPFSLPEFGPQIAPLLDGISRCEIGPGSPDASRESLLRQLSTEDLGGGRPLLDQASADACLAGLWLLHGFLDASHTISQGLSNADGSFWHGIMHRREGDYSNAKYWFRQTGRHAVFVALVEQSRPLATEQMQAESERDKPDLGRFLVAETWDPFEFVDLVERASRAGSPERPFCEKIAWIEWQLLFDHCYRRAFGPRR